MEGLNILDIACQQFVVITGQGAGIDASDAAVID
jgi:hypothetical protein